MRRPKRNEWDLIVAGGGIAGLTAALHGVRCGLKTLLLEGDILFGGQVANVEHLEGFPAAADISGTALATNLAEGVREAGGEIRHELASALDLDGSVVRVATENGSYRGARLIIASGARLRRLGVPGEVDLVGRGVSQCASCDGGFFRGQDVVVVGGGDAALMETLVLAPICRSVTIVSRSALKAKRSYVERVTAHVNVRFVWNSVVEEVLGSNGVQGVRVRDLGSGETQDVACTGLFPFIGSEPNSEWLPAVLSRDEGGFLVTEGLAAPGVEGVFAVGAIRSGYNGQLVTAAGEAVEAAERARG